MLGRDSGEKVLGFICMQAVLSAHGAKIGPHGRGSRGLLKRQVCKGAGLMPASRKHSAGQMLRDIRAAGPQGGCRAVVGAADFTPNALARGVAQNFRVVRRQTLAFDRPDPRLDHPPLVVCELRYGEIVVPGEVS